MPYGDFVIVPRIAVGAARAALQAQGIDPSILKDDGSLSATDLFSLAFDKVEIRTALTPNCVIDLRSPPNPETQAMLNRVKPTLIMTGRAGRVELAPYGAANPQDPFVRNAAAKTGLALGAALLGIYLIVKR